ncbi:MAG: DUF445 family protein [Deltaproteobacteria bacterium]|nr:DUF445 family protein [Deltaproteobacteria bacterium]
MTTRAPHLQVGGMRMLATGLLIAMAALFVALRLFAHAHPSAWIGWLQAFVEAAMVGALADWFAVTALFRHPLGLPIPHTAIISSNKDRIGESLGEFVQSNFLSAAILGRKLEQLDVASRITAWLSSDDRTRAASERVLSVLPEILSSLDDSDLRRFLRLNLNSLRRELPIAAGLSAVLRALVAGDKHQEVLNQGLLLAERLLDEQQVFIRETLREELPWYVPNFVHDKVYHDMVARVRSTLHAINQNPSHPARQRFSIFLGRLIDELKTSPQLESRCQELLTWIFESPLLAEYLDSVWNNLKAAAIARIVENKEETQSLLQRGLHGIGRALAQDTNIREKLNQFVVVTAQRMAHEYQSQIAALITDTVRNWDSATVVSKIEEQVGRDLQYIRINGTIVGGLVGLAIHAISNLLP